MYKRGLVFVIIILFICSSLVPIISSTINFQNIDDKNLFVSSIDTNKDKSNLTFYTFDKTGRKQNKVELSSDIAFEIKNMFDELEYNIVYEPRSVETQELKNSFISLIDGYDLISEKQSRNEVSSLLNPAWLKLDDNNSPRARYPLANKLFKSFFGSNIGTNIFCGISCAGAGMLMPLFMLPRPRAIGIWFSSNAVTSAANLLTGRGFLAGGVQSGLLLGFMGIGLTYAVPGYTVFGFIGYALFVGVSAELMEFYPPNQEPIISDESPIDGKFDVPISLSELSFRITDSDGDLMNYKVTTYPDIGSGSENLKPSGLYTVPISSLKNNSFYKWTVEVTDGKESTEKQFSFYTHEAPFNPFNERWHYRKQITINHSQIAEDFSNFSVLVHTIDTDLSTKAQPDGDDILFMDGSGEANKLYHEIESYKPSTGELLAWINIRNLKADENTIIYMYYGNPDSAIMQMSERAWDSYFACVWHLKESEGVIHDSTGRVSGGTIDGAQSVIGKIGSALEFLNQDIIYGISNVFDDVITSEFTVSSWIYWNGGQPNRNYYIFDGRDDSWNKAGFIFYIGNFHLRMYMNQPGSDKTSNATIPSNEWTYVSMTFDDNADEIRVYVNNQLDSINSTGAVYHNSDHYPAIGNNHWAPFDGEWAPLNGVIDELRIAKISRTTEWLLTEYNNQNNPSGFLIFGPEESPP